MKMQNARAHSLFGTRRFLPSVAKFALILAMWVNAAEPAHTEEVLSSYFLRTKDLAERGDAAAQNSIGSCYENGDGAARNLPESAKWYRRSAGQGYGPAQANLARYYARVRDYVQAYEWIVLSSSSPDNSGTVVYESILRLKAQVARSMTQKQLDSAEQLVREFKPQVEAGDLALAAAGRESMLRQKQSLQTAPPPPPPVVAAPLPADNAAARIEMVKEGGVLKVPIQLNGAITLKFVIDSGASEVQIPKDVFLTLMRAETIKEGDFLPGSSFEMADGTKIKSARFLLRSIKIGDSTVSNVEASIGDLNATLLLGQSFLSRFNEWKIDNRKSQLILTK
jgi:hypothetical protein